MESAEATSYLWTLRRITSFDEREVTFFVAFKDLVS